MSLGRFFSLLLGPIGQQGKLIRQQPGTLASHQNNQEKFAFKRNTRSGAMGLITVENSRSRRAHLCFLSNEFWSVLIKDDTQRLDQSVSLLARSK